MAKPVWAKAKTLQPHLLHVRAAAKTSRIIFEANKVMRAYDQSVDGTDAQDRMHAMALDYVKEKKTRRLATKAAIAMGVIILLVVGLNAGLQSRKRTANCDRARALDVP